MKFLRALLVLVSVCLADEVTVLKIFDGDTILVKNNGEKQVIRLIGIDTPEITINPKTVRDSIRIKKSQEEILKLGKTSKEYLQSILLLGEKIKLEYDVERYNGKRVLAYVYNKAGEMINLKLIEAGFATTMTVPPNVKYAERFKEAQKVAREEKKGHWNE